jgi:hypothetical protein
MNDSAKPLSAPHPHIAALRQPGGLSALAAASKNNPLLQNQLLHEATNFAQQAGPLETARFCRELLDQYYQLKISDETIANIFLRQETTLVARIVQGLFQPAIERAVNNGRHLLNVNQLTEEPKKNPKGR